MRITEAVELYIDRRHVEGFTFVNQAGRLRAFGKHVGDIEVECVRPEQVTSFLRSGALSDISFRERHASIARLIDFWQLRGEMPRFVMPSRPKYVHQLFTPYVYTSLDIRKLLRATFSPDQGARRTIPPETMRALLLFLYGTGSTLLSCVALRAEDLDLGTALVTLTNRRGHGSRTVPINRDLISILRRYLDWKYRKGFAGSVLFVQQDGKPLTVSTVGSYFRKLLELANCHRTDGFCCRPRLYDFRATFAVRRITTWIKSGDDLGRKLPALAAYMGQIDLTTTERFLTLSPERFRKELDKLSPLQGRSWSQDRDLLAFLQAL